MITIIQIYFHATNDALKSQTGIKLYCKNKIHLFFKLKLVIKKYISEHINYCGQ